jgi:putative heme-binding domain-containing protein
LTTDDQLHFGQLRRDDAKGLLLVDPTGTAIEIPRAEIQEQRPSKQSVMPEGLCHTMSPQEFADLIAWLAR